MKKLLKIEVADNKIVDSWQESMIKFCDEHKIFDAIGELCLVGCGYPEVAKLVAIAQDTTDFYYVLKYQDRGLIYNTCVDRCQNLKGKIDEYDYHLKRYDGFLEMNSHFLNEGARTDLKELKERAKQSNMGVYESREELVNNYFKLNYDI